MLKIKIYLILFFGLLTTNIIANTYPNVLFENSVMSGSYGHSLVSYSGFSWVENVKGRIPLSDSKYFTPSNSISLKYTSSDAGKWELYLFFPDGTAYVPGPEDRYLSMRVNLQELSATNSLPLISLDFGDTCSHALQLSAYLPSEDTDKWMHVKIPLSDFGFHLFDKDTRLNGLIFSQNGPTTVDVANHILVDQIEVIGDFPEKVELAYPAVLSQAQPFEKHVRLTWQLPLNPSIRYVKIYRSRDNENFVPVGMSPVFANSYADMVPAANRTYYYRISWVDFDYEESPMSRTLEARTATLSDEEFLDLIQTAHINFFLERTEVNSGMHQLSFSEVEASVSVKETGYSLMAHLVGVEREFTSFNVWFKRLERVVNFLEDAEHYYGAFPRLLDGRSGKGVYSELDSVQKVDLESTATLLQALLISAEYLKRSDLPKEEFKDNIDNLLEKIGKIWTRVDWKKFALDNDRILYEGWSPEAGFRYAKPMGGFNIGFLSYVLALSAPEHAINPEAYSYGLGVNRALADQVEEPPIDLELVDNPAFQLVQEDEIVVQDTFQARGHYVEMPFTVDTLLYGVEIPLGSIEKNLLYTYALFFAFDPIGSQDSFADYGKSIANLTEAYKRRDNEMNAGNYSLEIWGTEQGGSDESQLPVLVPAISAASYAFRPVDALKSLRSYYGDYGQYIFTELGFRSWINFNENTVASEFSALNQGAVAIMIENGRSGLLWSLFMNHPDVLDFWVKHFRQE